MKFAVYAQPGDTYLLIPDCLSGADYIYGSHRCGTIESDEYPLPALWAAIAVEVDARACAEVQGVIVRRLLGLGYEEASGMRH